MVPAMTRNPDPLFPDLGWSKDVLALGGGPQIPDIWGMAEAWLKFPQMATSHPPSAREASCPEPGAFSMNTSVLIRMRN